MRLGAGQPIWRQHDHRVDLPTPSGVPQTIQRWTIQPCATDAIIDILMLGQQYPALVLNVLLEPAPLTLDRTLLLLMTRRDSRI
jgi:hypothetical protein